MKYLFALFLALTPVFAFSQTRPELSSEKTYNYKILRNDPKNARNFTGILEPLYVDLNGLNINAGFNGGFKYRFKNVVAVDLNYRRAYIQLTEDEFDEFSTHGFSKYENPKENSLNIQLEISPIKKVKKVDVTVKLKSSGNVTYVAEVPADRLNLMSIRTGLQKGVGLVSGEMIYFEGTPVGTDVSESFGGFNFSNVYRYSTINIGFSYTNITDLITHWEDFGERKTESSFEIYGDLLIAAVMELDNMYVGSSGNYIEMDLSDTPKNRVGGRVGFTDRSLSSVGVSYGGEIGIRPGPVENTNLYLTFRLGIAFSAFL